MFKKSSHRYENKSKAFAILGVFFVTLGLASMALMLFHTLKSHNSSLGYIGTLFRDYKQYDNEKAVRVLFVGNSHTFSYDLDKLVMEISLTQTDQHYHIYADRVANGALQTLQDHWDNGLSLRTIKARKWDYVILQGQSGMPLYGKNRSLFLKYAKLFSQEIAATGAKTIFYGTWPYKENIFRDYNIQIGNPDFHYRVINSIYMKVAKKNNASVVLTAPIRAYAPQEIELYQPDGNHNSLAGAYINALAFYKHIFGITRFAEDTFIPFGVSDADGLKEPVKKIV